MDFNIDGVGYEPRTSDVDVGLATSAGGAPLSTVTGANTSGDASSATVLQASHSGRGPLDFSADNAWGAGAGVGGATGTVAAGAGPAGIAAGVGRGENAG